MEAHETPFETSNLGILSEVEDESEGSLRAEEIASLVVRTVTVLLTLLGGLLLVNKIKRRGSITVTLCSAHGQLSAHVQLSAYGTNNTSKIFCVQCDE